MAGGDADSWSRFFFTNQSVGFGLHPVLVCASRIEKHKKNIDMKRLGYIILKESRMNNNNLFRPRSLLSDIFFLVEINFLFIFE